jgi:hypothetical protein
MVERFEACNLMSMNRGWIAVWGKDYGSCERWNFLFWTFPPDWEFIEGKCCFHGALR